MFDLNWIYIKSKDRNNRISFCFFLLLFLHLKLDTFSNTHNTYIIGSWQLISIMWMNGFDVAVVMTAAAVQKLDQLWIVVLCPGTVTTTPSYQWIFYGFTFAVSAIEIVCTMKGKHRKKNPAKISNTEDGINCCLNFNFPFHEISFYLQCYCIFIWWSGLFFLIECNKSVKKWEARVKNIDRLPGMCTRCVWIAQCKCFSYWN